MVEEMSYPIPLERELPPSPRLGFSKSFLSFRENFSPDIQMTSPVHFAAHRSTGGGGEGFARKTEFLPSLKEKWGQVSD